MNRTSIAGKGQSGPAHEPPQPESAFRVTVMSEDRNRMIAEAAYFRALQRGFLDGYELADWLDAEKEIDARLLG